MATCSAAFDVLLEFARASVDELTAEDIDQRPSDDHAEHAAELHVQAVGRAGSPGAELREPPRTLHGLALPLHLAPPQTGRPLVLEANDRLDRADLRVGKALHERHVTRLVA